MTTEEKLKHFLDFSMNDARIQSERIISEYEASINKQFEEHKEEKNRQAALQIKNESDHLERIKNKELSEQQLIIKRKLGSMHNELRDKLFSEVRGLLEAYMDTPAYDDLLIQQIKEAKKYSNEQEIIIYIDKKDIAKLSKIKAATGIDVTVSEESFFGGTRAVIPSRNLLMDNSFESKLEELKAGFRFNGGASNA